MTELQDAIDARNPDKYQVGLMRKAAQRADKMQEALDIAYDALLFQPIVTQAGNDKRLKALAKIDALTAGDAVATEVV